MRYRLAVIAVLTGLLVSGCSSGMTLDEGFKLAEYEACLDDSSRAYLDLYGGNGNKLANKSLNSFADTLIKCEQYKR